jgi:hypothetical protein
MTTNAQAAYIAASNMRTDSLDASQLAEEIRDNLNYMDKMSGPRSLMSKIEEVMGSPSIPRTTLWGETYDNTTHYTKEIA